MASHQAIDSRLTLEQGLEEFRRRHSAQLYTRDMSEDSREFFRRHDISHVVFDCGISLVEEGMVKTWTAFGTTLGFWKHIAAYSRVETREIVREMSVRDVMATFFRSLVVMPRVLGRCRTMSKRWPWDDHDEYLGRQLVDIRREFNIRPLIVA